MAYEKQTFTDGLTILMASHLKHIEDGIVAVENLANQAKQTADGHTTQISTLEGKTVAATQQALGLVKQSALVPEAAGDNVTKEEFKALLDALKAAGIMANA